MGIVAIGLSGLLMLLSFGFVWVIGMDVLLKIFDSLPLLPETSSYFTAQEDLKSTVISLVTWVPALFFAYFCIKTFINSSRTGSD